MEYPVNEYLSIRLIRTLMTLIGMWPAKIKWEEKLSNILLVYAVFNMAVAVLGETVDLYFTWGDLTAFSYVAPLASTVYTEMAKLLVFTIMRREVMLLNSFTENTFWKVKYDDVDLQILQKCEKKCFASGMTFLVLAVCVLFFTLLLPVYESRGKKGTDRILPFKWWIEFLPWYESPYYECAYAIQTFSCSLVCLFATTFAVFTVTINQYAAAQFEILHRKVTNMCEPLKVSCKDKCWAENLILHALKQNIRVHQMLINYVDQLERMSCFIFLGQVFSSVVQICFSGFQLIINEEASVERMALSMIYLSASFAQLYCFSFSAHEVFIKSESVAEAAYNAKWYLFHNEKFGKQFGTALTMMVMKARRPCVLTVGKFVPFSIQTFMSVAKSSFSFLTLLRSTAGLD